MSRVGDALFSGLVTGLVIGLPTVVMHIAKQSARNADDLTPIVQKIATESDTLSTAALRALNEEAVSDHLIDVLRASPRFIESRAEYVERFVPDTLVAFASPDSANEFSNIFLREGSAAEIDQTSRISSEISSDFDGNAIRLTEGNQLIELLANSDQNVVIVIAHNDQGVMRLPDGSTVTIEDFANACDEFEKRCIVLSCDAQQFLPSGSTTVGVTTEITFPEAIRISRVLWNKNSSLLNKARGEYSSWPDYVEMFASTSLFSLDLTIREQLAFLESATRTVRHVERSATIVGLTGTSATIVYAINQADPGTTSD